MKLSLNNTNNVEKLKSGFLSNGYVKIPNALSSSCAHLLYENILEQKQWNIVFKNQNQHQDLNNLEVEAWEDKHKDKLMSMIHTQASTGFQYFYETIPIYDIYYDNLMPGHFFNDILEFLNRDDTLNYFRELLGAPEISFLDAQITRFNAGHFLNCHSDDVNGKNRVAAFVINLSKEWRADWGGALHILNDDLEIDKSFLPSFNEINIFKVPVEHLVGVVAPFAMATGYR
jgi:Rps23 Pro-64 3,4-dihydroxylase Tpa1-like proline 4-hydroxylase